MQINVEQVDAHSVQSYTESNVLVNGIQYDKSLLIAQDRIVSPWGVKALGEITIESLEPIFALKPEVILVGHPEIGVMPPVSLLAALSKQRIGLECMSLGAACRTFNVLLSEKRSAILGVIFN